MRVAIIADLEPGGLPVGGVQRSTAALVPGLIDAGVDVTVIAPNHSGSVVERDVSYGFPVLRVPMRERLQLLRGYRPWTEACGAVLRNLNPEIVQGQALLHNGAAAVGWTGCPRIVAAHGDPLADARQHYPRAASLVLVPLLRDVVSRTIRSADAVTNVTPDWRVNCPVEPPRHVFIPNPVEDVFFDGPVPPVNAKRILFFGLARKIKGFDLLMEAWPLVRRSVPDATLEVFGPTPEEVGRFMRHIDANALGIHIHGPVSKDRVAQEMRSGGVLVVPSRYEVAPLVIAEAWAIGIPVVATDVGGIRAMAGDRAVLATPTVAGIAERLVSEMRDDRGLARAVVAGRDISESYRLGAVVSGYERLYSASAGETSS